MAGLLFIIKLNCFILTLTLSIYFFGFSYSGPILPCENIGPTVDPNISQLSPEELVQQTPYLDELMGTYQYAGSMFRHYDLALRQHRT